jgi:signal transduction histidine kinase
LEKQNVASIKREYNQILEQMPEGILIINKRGKIEFINEELRDVLNVEEAGQESQGLYVKMFKSYNIEDDIDNFKEDDCVSDCIHTIVEDDEWQEDEDRYFELDICGCETTQDEDRIFTQIRKLKI